MLKRKPLDFKKSIRASGLDIYSPIEVGDANLWIPTPHIETLLNKALKGLNLGELPVRTRSKVVKIAICEALGYPAPKSFKRTKPRFFGQQLDTYAQKSRNLQIWNEQLSPARRYAIIQISAENRVLKVKVVNGYALGLLDKTGKITTKYQAALEVRAASHELVSTQDATLLLPHVHASAGFDKAVSPVNDPVSGKLLPIQEVYKRLSTLVGQTFADPGKDQERNRGAALHKLICQYLGYSRYEDTGQFPDIRHQLLEVKLQTSPTIDLGLVLPSSEERLDISQLGDVHPRHCDTRYAMFFAKTDGRQVTLTHLFVTTGADFFKRFRRFEGKGINGKIQIPLPQEFFST
ncbi:MAG: restriction endonuclease [Sideroxydans sp.]|nr:restriction endonuclease [Sideroxydans sp.]